MTQGVLFPLKVRHHQPPRGRGKDVKVEAVAEDGMEWVLKRQKEHPHLPATEMFCYRLAQACGLATPMDGILTDLDGSLVFGSRVEGGLLELSALPQAEVIQRIGACSGRMSASYALDLLVGNRDRHFGNFLFRSRSDGSLAAMAIDWSRSWLVNGWPLPTVATPSATTNHITVMRGIGRWSPAEALLTLGTVSAIPSTTVDAWIGEMPPAWMSPADRGKVAAWWGSQDFHARISECVNYCR